MSLTTRQAMIAAATELLDEGGPGAVTLRAVALKVGVSHNAPYRHFADKEALLAAVAAGELRHRSQNVRVTPAPGADALAELKRMTLGYVRWGQRYPARFKLTFGAWTTPNAELGEAAAEAREQFVAAVRAAQAAGQIGPGDPDRVSALVLALAHGAVDQALAGHLSRDGKGAADPEDLVEDLFTLLRIEAPN